MGGESPWSCDSELRGWRRATLGLLRGLRDVGAGRAERSRRPQPAMLPGDKGPTLGAAQGRKRPTFLPSSVSLVSLTGRSQMTKDRCGVQGSSRSIAEQGGGVGWSERREPNEQDVPTLRSLTDTHSSVCT